MNNPSFIEHRGLVSEIRDNILKIRLVDPGECSSCHIKDFCNGADPEKDLYEVPSKNTHYKVGDEVVLRIMPSTGLKALFWGYLAPFCLILAVLLLAVSFKINELWAGVIALAVLPVYYLLLASFREKIRKQVRMDIRVR